MITYQGIQIEQQYAKIGMWTEKGQQTIRQPRATFELDITPPKLDIRSPRGELTIDQSRAWDALSVGSNLDFMSRIYKQSLEFGLEGIARIVEQGNRLAAIHLPGNPIAEIARENAFRDLPITYHTLASNDNVDISYERKSPEIELIRGRVDGIIQRNNPEINYEKGRLHYEMLQYQWVKFIPPQWEMSI